jgi:probable rRNA maturation factor
MKINVGINNLAEIDVDEKLVKKVTIGVIKGEAGGRFARRNIEVSIAFVGPGQIRGINKKYRKKDYATDVLSFAEDGDFTKDAGNHPRILGELVICPEVVGKDAAEAGTKNKEELVWVVIHGILHLFGYDHETDEADARVMREKEDFYISKFKVKSAKLKAKSAK